MAFTGHPALGSLFQQPPAEPTPSVADFRQQVDEAWTLVHASSYVALSDHPAKLLPSIETAVRYAPAGDRPELHPLRAKAYLEPVHHFSGRNR
ncbi:hypothetical protein [Streptomyces sp. NPDC003393]